MRSRSNLLSESAAKYDRMQGISPSIRGCGGGQVAPRRQMGLTMHAGAMPCPQLHHIKMSPSFVARVAGPASSSPASLHGDLPYSALHEDEPEEAFVVSGLVSGVVSPVEPSQVEVTGGYTGREKKGS